MSAPFWPTVGGLADSGDRDSVIRRTKDRAACRSFAANAVRLQIHALACNFGNFPRTLATPEPITDWPLTTLNEKLIKIGAKAVSRGRYVAFQMAEVATSFSCVISTCNAGLLVDPPADARKNLRQSQHERLATGHEHERLRLIGEFEKPPGQAYRNDIVFVAVQDEDGNMHVADREVRAKPIEHQPIHRKDRIMRRGDVVWPNN